MEKLELVGFGNRSPVVFLGMESSRIDGAAPNVGDRSLPCYLLLLHSVKSGCDIYYLSGPDLGPGEGVVRNTGHLPSDGTRGDSGGGQYATRRDIIRVPPVI